MSAARDPLALLSGLAASLAEICDPRARHWLILSMPGAAEWLQRHCAQQHGICSLTRHVRLRTALETPVSEPGRSSVSIDHLALAIAARAPDLRPLLPLPPDLILEPGIDGRLLAWARRLAQALDDALLCRLPEDPLPPEHPIRQLMEHPDIAPLLVGHLARFDDAAYRAAARRWCAQGLERGHLPHLWIALDGGRPTLELRHLLNLRAVYPPDRFHLWGLEPATVFWGDERTGRRQAGLWDDDSEGIGPVLPLFGRRLQELHNQAIDHDLFAPDPHQAPPEGPASLLGRLQRCCRADGDPLPAWPAIAAVDDSFSVHACRGPLRELEVARDRILAALDHDQDLEPHDILVLLADPAGLAPLVTAAFQGAADPAARLPLRLLTLGATIPAASAVAIDSLLDAITGRLDQDALHANLSQPAIARAFGLNDADRPIAWLDAAGFRWGSDGADRAHHQGHDAPIDERWSLAGALRRLALGATVDPAQRDAVVAGAAPLDRAGGLQVDRLARLADYAAMIEEERPWWRGRHSLDAWTARCTRLIERCIAPEGPDQARDRDELLAGLRRRCQGLDLAEARLDADAFRRLLRPLLDEMGDRHTIGRGGITVAALGHYAGTPATMTVICGLGDATFPARTQLPQWHPVHHRPRPGDPNRRHDDRHHLLLSLMATGRRLVLTYAGGSLGDDRPLPPSTPVADLLTVARSCGADDRRHPAGTGLRPGAIHLAHGLNGFSPAAHQGPSDSRSLLADEHRLALALSRQDDAPVPGLWGTALAPVSGVSRISERDLLDLVRAPCRLFLRRAGLLAPEVDEPLNSDDRLQLTALDHWALRRQLMTRLLEQPAPARPQALAALRERLDCAGDLPPASLGAAAWDTAVAAMPALPELTQAMPPPPPLVLEADADGGPWQLTCTPDDSLHWFYDAQGQACCLGPSSCPDTQPHRSLLLMIRALLRDLDSLRLYLPDGIRELRLPPDTALRRRLLRRCCALVEAVRCLPVACDSALFDAAYGPRLLAAADLVPIPDMDQAAIAWQEGAGFNGAPASALSTSHRLCFRSLADPLTLALPTDGAAADLWHRIGGGDHSRSEVLLRALAEIRHAARLVSGDEA